MYLVIVSKRNRAEPRHLVITATLLFIPEQSLVGHFLVSITLLIRPHHKYSQVFTAHYESDWVPL